jgi:enterochelin esterase-like enzyme
VGVRRLVLLPLVLALAGPAAAQAPAPLPAFTKIESGPAGGAVLNGLIPGSPTGRTSLVYLPPGFPRGGPYPVAYLLHGMPGSPWEYTQSLRLATVADGLISTGRARPFIAVMPVAGDTARYNGEWTGPWESYLVQSVVPWADSHLPTEARPAGRVLAGLSAGGYGAVDIGLRHPTLFGTLESWSGYFSPIADGTLTGLSTRALAAYTPTSLVRANVAALRATRTRFVLSTGPSHGRIRPQDTVAFARELQSLALPYRLWVLHTTKVKSAYYPQLVHGLLAAFSTTAG